MKNILIIIILFFLQSNMFAQKNYSADSIKYLAGYNAIIDDSINQEKSFIISDSLVRLNIAVFFRELKQKDNDSLVPQLYGIYQNVDSFSKLTFLSDKSRRCSKNILFFSPIINDSILCAELFKNKSNLSKNEYLDVAMFSTSYMYLFVFDEMGKIKSMFRKEMIYN
ncbi:hypothetical protein [Bacteroides nordii]|uniref:hypothetical protein n=1 Tax=Bacteroides nordii TaxID=291645 RepID=UPI002A81676B|nr:hypothetical protein [Bacteroides nordii]